MNDAATILTSSFSADWLQAALWLIVITDLALLAAERQRLCIRLIALQGCILGLMPLIALPGSIDPHLLGVAAIFLGVKGVILPLLLRRTYRKLPPQPPANPYLGNTACVLVGVCGFAFSLWFGGRLGVSSNPLLTLIFPPAFATIFAGLLLIVTRRKALGQMFGYLIMENGIYLLGVPMAQQDAVWLELSILLDILVGAFVMGIAIHHLNRAFDSTDVEEFASLRD